MRVSKIASIILCCTLLLSLIAAAPVPVIKITLKDPLPVPSQADQTSAEKRIREIYSADFSKPSSADRTALANRLLAVAFETRDDPSAHYVLLSIAINLAASANDASLAIRALDRLQTDFAIDAAKTADQLLPLLRADAASQALPAAKACFIAMDWAIQSENADLALKFLQQARKFADRSLDRDLINQAVSRELRLKAVLPLMADAPEAQKTLSENPADPASAQKLGQYYLVVKNQPQKALPLFAKSDSPLADASKTDLTNPAKPLDQFNLANTWWSLSENEPEALQFSLQQRAAHHYLKAAPALQGLSHETALKRILDAQGALAKNLCLSPGLSTEIFATESFQKPLKSRIDPSLDYDNSSKPDSDLPKSNYSIRYTAQLLLPATGQYEFTLIANDGARLFIDDQKALDEPNLSQKRNGAKFTLDSQLRNLSLRLEHWNASGIGRCRLLWKSPLTGKEEPVPFLFH